MNFRIKVDFYTMRMFWTDSELTLQSGVEICESTLSTFIGDSYDNDWSGRDSLLAASRSSNLFLTIGSTESLEKYLQNNEWRLSADRMKSLCKDVNEQRFGWGNIWHFNNEGIKQVFISLNLNLKSRIAERFYERLPSIYDYAISCESRKNRKLFFYLECGPFMHEGIACEHPTAYEFISGELPLWVSNFSITEDY